jgi:hypothetical protein
MPSFFHFCLGRDIQNVTPAVTRVPFYFGLIQWITPFSLRLRQTRACTENLTWISMGPDFEYASLSI